MENDDVTSARTGSSDAEPIYDDPWDIARPSFLKGFETEYEVRQSAAELCK